MVKTTVILHNLTLQKIQRSNV